MEANYEDAATGGRTASWPDRDTERWARSLERYPSLRGLERMAERHEDAAAQAGWRMIGGAWEPPRSPQRLMVDGAQGRKLIHHSDIAIALLEPDAAPAEVFVGWASKPHSARLGVKAAEQRIRRFAVAMLRDDAPTAPRRSSARAKARADYLAVLLDHTAEVTGESVPVEASETEASKACRETMRLAEVYLYEGLTWLLVYETTEEVILRLLDPDAVSVATRARRLSDDPMRARFGSPSALLSTAAAPVASIGVGSPRYEIAGAAGRTKALWSEVSCQGSHTQASGVQNLAQVERRIDAHQALRGLVLSPRAPEAEQATWDAIRAWMTSGAKKSDCTAVFRAGLTDDAPEWTDRAIGKHLGNAHAALVRHLRRAPGLAERVAWDTSDTGFLAPLVRMKDGEPPRPRSRRPSAEILRGEASL